MTNSRLVRLWCVGDSVTAGGNAAPTGAYRHGLRADLLAEGYAFLMVGSVAGNEYGTESPILYHDGQRGYNVERLMQDIVELQDEARPDLALLMIGTNNFATMWRADVREGASGLAVRLIETILAGTGRPHLVVSSIPPADHITTPPGTNALIDRYNADLEAAVTARAALGASLAWVDPELTTADLVDTVHPNDAGYLKIRNAFKAACDDYFEALA